MKFTTVILIYQLFVCRSSNVICASSEEANKNSLFSTVFKNYVKELRPRCGENNGTVKVTIGIGLRQIIGLNEIKQILSTNLWIRLAWRDCHLTWNATEFNGIGHILVPQSQIWIPDITIYDNADYIVHGLEEYYRPKISSDGSIYYMFPSVVNSLCHINVGNFPFDSQICRITLGSWTYNGQEVDVVYNTTSGDLSSYLQNGEWSVEAFPVERHLTKYECCSELYPDIRFFLHLKRKPFIYELNLIFPCMLITAISMLGFILPPESGEKVSVSITVLLSLAVFLWVVTETLPPNSDTIPYIGIFFAASMVLVCFCCMMSVVVLNIFFKGSHGQPVPPWVRRCVLGWLAKLVHMNYDVQIFHKRQIISTPCFIRSLNTRHAMNKERNLKKCLQTEVPNENGGASIECRFAELSVMVQNQMAALSKLKEFLDKKKEDRLKRIEWEMIALVVNRISLLVAMLIFVILGIMLQVIKTLHDRLP